jgi:hypothetical protein
MSNPGIHEHLASICNGLNKVCAITRGLGAEPEQEAIENALSQRETVLFAEVDTKARELSAAFPNWHAWVKNDETLRKLLGEAEDLMHSITLMDETISQTLKRRMSGVKAKLSSLYHASRAACSYTAQSKLRSGQ